MDAPKDIEPSNFNLPLGTKERIRDAMASMRLNGEEAPTTMRDFVVAAINEKIARIPVRKPSR